MQAEPALRDANSEARTLPGARDSNVFGTSRTDDPVLNTYAVSVIFSGTLVCFCVLVLVVMLIVHCLFILERKTVRMFFIHVGDSSESSRLERWSTSLSEAFAFSTGPSSQLERALSTANRRIRTLEKALHSELGNEAWGIENVEDVVQHFDMTVGNGESDSKCGGVFVGVSACNSDTSAAPGGSLGDEVGTEDGPLGFRLNIDPSATSMPSETRRSAALVKKVVALEVLSPQKAPSPSADVCSFQPSLSIGEGSRESGPKATNGEPPRYAVSPAEPLGSAAEEEVSPPPGPKLGIDCKTRTAAVVIFEAINASLQPIWDRSCMENRCNHRSESRHNLAFYVHRWLYVREK